MIFEFFNNLYKNTISAVNSVRAKYKNNKNKAFSPKKV